MLRTSLRARVWGVAVGSAVVAAATVAAFTPYCISIGCSPTGACAPER